MKAALMTALVLLSIQGTAMAQQQRPSAENGKQVYDKWCTPCHGTEVVSNELIGFQNLPLPGTSALAVKYKGDLPALLEERTDLQPAYIRSVVRGGLFGMPITRKTEVSESELNDIIAYLTRTR